MSSQVTKKTKTQTTTPRPDAIALLKADHRLVEELFDACSKARSPERVRALALEICSALRVHMAIEEELFYPAFLDATDETEMHHEAVVEHAGARRLMDEIEASSPDDDYFDSKVHVLSELIKHHLKEEEGRDGLFAAARDSSMDLDALGLAMSERKEALERSPERTDGAEQDASLPPLH